MGGGELSEVPTAGGWAHWGFYLSRLGSCSRMTTDIMVKIDGGWTIFVFSC